ncbi:CHC2 zinc finger domain-containing protein [Mesorhizobium sp.]|uniref:DUF7146 domain-containing protein n=1 Tax=Mesorhizobium sp. TaxID=1871066 RepID=UPI000FE4F109|nr:CHC2 zinc finger domain-containing protein [Mesorhizobium sp.]RWM29436.1 MAG: hypothetical protein EOR74_07085 [Mesorhizobium sp.]
MPRIDPIELEDLKSRTPLSRVFEMYGVRSKGSPKARWANCCFHGERTPSLKINDERGRFGCFGCGAGGDHFTVLQELGGKTFMEAVETLGGVRLVTAEERKVIEDRSTQWAAEEAEEKKKARKSSERLFNSGVSLMGTHAEAYLAARALPVVKRWTFDLRFVPALEYRGYPDGEAEETVVLGSYPAMIAAIRDKDMVLIGVHRTYLDPQQPKKLLPPGCQRRNKAKKVLGEQTGGMIWLTPVGARLATGEGIETTRSWYALGYGDDDIALAASVSLGNMAGGATGSQPHPKDPNKRVPNGIPDEDRPGVILPVRVKEVILLGDGDSDPYMTRARMMVAGRRFRKQGREVFVSMAPDGKDFSNVLQEEQQS